MENEYVGKSPGRCSECQGELVTSLKGHCLAVTCLQCGWSVATSYFTPIERDHTNYQIYAKQNAAPNKDQIRAISHLSGLNFVQVKAKLQQGDFLVCEKKAPDILCVQELLDEKDIEYYIAPEFIFTKESLNREAEFMREMRLTSYKGTGS